MKLWAGLGVAAALVLFATQTSARCVIEAFAVLPVTMYGLKATVPAKVNGTDARFTIDSGDFYNTMSPAAAARFHLPKTMAPFASVAGVGGDTGVSVAKVRAFTLAGAPVKNVYFAVPKQMSDTGFDGNLGQNLLGSADVDYDLADGVIRLVRPKGCGGKPLAYWLKPGEAFGQMDLQPMHGMTPFTIGTVKVDGFAVTAEFETGSGYSALSLAAARRVGIPYNSMIPIAPVGGVGGRLVRSWIAPVASFEIGGEKIEHTNLRVIDSSWLGNGMVIGADFFLSHHIYVANGQGKLYFTYNGGPVFKLGVPPQAPVTRSTVTAQAAPMPTDAAALARRGAALTARREYPAAIDAFSRAITLSPGVADYRLRRGEAYAASKQSGPAMADYDAALKLSPEDSEAHLARAMMRLKAPDKGPAIEDLDAAAKALPQGSGERLAIADLYHRAGALSPEIGQLDLWIASHRGDAKLAPALNRRCWARGLLGREAALALADCDAALKLWPKQASFLDSRGLARLRLGDYAQAISDYDAALKQRPKTAWSLYGRGLAELRSGQIAKGRINIAAAAALDPSLPGVAAAHGLAP